MLGAQSVAKAFPEYPTTIVKVYPPALHLKDYISMAGPEVMTVGRGEGAQKTFLVILTILLSVLFHIQYRNCEATDKCNWNALHVGAFSKGMQAEKLLLVLANTGRLFNCCRNGFVCIITL